MKKKIFITIITGFLITNVHAQQITVRDNSTQEKIVNVLIRDSKNNSATTNANGIVDISTLEKSDSLLFTHPAYFKIKILYETQTEVYLPSKLIQLDEIVFSANRLAERKIDVPQTVEIVDQKQIEFGNQQTSADVLQNTGNVFVQKSQLGGGSAVLRGFEANKILIVVDGMRMNNCISRAGHLQDLITVDAQMLERTEVLYGPSSTMYGSDALGGVMHFYTKNAQFSTEDKALIKVNTMGRYSSANTENTGHLDFNIGLKNVAFLTNVTYSSYGDLRAGNNHLDGYSKSWRRDYYVERFNNTDSVVKNLDPKIQKQSGYSQMDIMQRINVKQGEHVVHGINFQYSQSSYVPRYDRLAGDSSGGNFKFAENGYDLQKRMLASYNLNIDSKTAISDNIKIILGYQKFDQDRITRRFNSVNRKIQMEDVAVYSLNADLFKKIKEIHELHYGLEFTYNDLQSTAKMIDITTNIESPSDTRYPDGGSKMMTMAAYVSHSMEIDKNTILVSGVRFTSTDLESKFVDTTFFKFPYTSAKQTNQAATGNVGIVFKSDNNWKASLLASSGFRAPNVDDMAKVFESSGGYLIVPNLALKPEYAYNMELNISKTVEDKFKIDVTAFYTMLENAIVVKAFKYNGADSILCNGTMNKVQATQNIDRAFIYGLTGGVAFDLSQNLSFKSVLNYTYGRYMDVTSDIVTPLGHIPPVFGQTNLMYKKSRVEGDFFVRYNGAKRSKDYQRGGEDNEIYSADASNGYMPGWFTLNLRIGYNITKNFRFNVACENITDNHYRTFASGISSPGRNFILSLRYKM